MDLLEIGAALHEGRERKGLSLESVEEKTKIAQPVITALEAGDRERFPHPVYAKGFVRSYALLLGLDATELCTHFSREYPVPSDTESGAEEQAPQIRVKLKNSRKHSVVLWAASTALALALGLGAWYAYDLYMHRPQQTAPPTPSTEPSIAPPKVPMAPATQREEQDTPLTQMREVAAEAEDAKASMAAQAVANSNANVTSSLTLPKGTAQNSTGNATGGAKILAKVEAATNQTDAAGPVGPERTMVVTARSASWLQARPDGKVLDYFLRKGESATIPFSKSLTIKFGNAGGINLELDGKAYPLDAKSGAVKTLVIK